MTDTEWLPALSGTPLPARAPLGGPPPADLSVLRLLNFLLRHWKLVVSATVLTAAAIVVMALVQPRMYTATTSFMLERESSQNSAGGLAAQLGLALPGATSTESPQFYLELLRVVDLRRAIAMRQYAVRGGTGTLDVAYGLTGMSPRLAQERAIERLDKQMHPSASAKTGIVSISVTTTDPALSAQIAQGALAVIQEFNTRRRQVQTASAREFFEQQMPGGRQELTQAEDRLQEFLNSNRNYQGAPKLVFEEARLSRDVSIQQQLYISLAQGYLQAKLDEVRNTPSISVLQSAEPPLFPDGRGLIRSGLFGILAGVCFGSLAALIAEYFARAREFEPDEFSEFQALRRSAARSLRNPLRALRRD